MQVEPGLQGDRRGGQEGQEQARNGNQVDRGTHPNGRAL